MPKFLQRFQEHAPHTKNQAADNFGSIGHSTIINHMIKFDETSVLKTCNSHHDRMILDEIEIIVKMALTRKNKTEQNLVSTIF